MQVLFVLCRVWMLSGLESAWRMLFVFGLRSAQRFFWGVLGASVFLLCGSSREYRKGPMTELSYNLKNSNLRNY